MKFAAVIAALALAVGAQCSSDDTYWMDIWTASPQLNKYTPPAIAVNPGGYFRNMTIRQTLKLTLATDQVRVKLSNEFGTSPLEITASTVALTGNNQAGNSTIVTNTLQKLTYNGSASVTIPVGGTVLSDAVNMTTAVYQELSTSLYLAQGQIGNATTAHSVAHTTSWLGAGDQTADLAIRQGTSTPSWYYVTEIQGLEPTTNTALICIGDSITDGTGSTMNGNNRWVDDLFRRTQANSATQNIAVLNAGIGGNHLVTTPGTGPTAVQRIKSVMSQPGVRYVTILEGVNDIGHTATNQSALDALYTQMVSALEEIIDEVHAAGLPIFGATLTPSFDDPASNPDKSTYSNPLRAATRARFNTWIKTEAKFDYVVDYAAAVDDPSNPNMYLPEYAYTNYIHPDVAGHLAMADAWDISVFPKFANGTSSS